MRTALPDAFIGRQPIFDRSQHVVAYELLFRAGRDHGEAQISDGATATASVVQLAFRDLGINTVVGPCRAFINIDSEFLLSHVLETLPQDRVVLEILESVDIDERMLRRCRQLRALGYQIALDDFLYREDYDQLLDIVDIVKIDLMKVSPASLPNLVQRLNLRRVKLVAEKVESAERMRECRGLGFDLFQGFLFGRPSMLYG